MKKFFFFRAFRGKKSSLHYSAVNFTLHVYDGDTVCKAVDKRRSKQSCL